MLLVRHIPHGDDERVNKKSSQDKNNPPPKGRSLSA